MAFDVMAVAAKERIEDAKRAREQAKKIGDPIVRDHLLRMASDLEDQARELTAEKHGDTSTR
ncbi:MAG: hypothetical protein OXQ31_16175 [Spirochaetaceae bacterium]|nr:hypothetical protein [Spirochaetaceae bacterium]